MADDRLPCWRSESIVATRSDKVRSRPTAICLSPLQKASSRLTLVLCPAMTIERLTTGDFIARPPLRCGGGRVHGGHLLCVALRARVRLCFVRAIAGWRQHLVRLPAARPSCAPYED